MTRTFTAHSSLGDELQVHMSADGTVSIVPAKDAITAGLGDKVNALIALSPSLQNDLEVLSEQDWKIEYGPEGGGSKANRRDKVIVLDRALEGNTEQHAKARIQVLSHEVGHALYPYTPKLLSVDDYINGVSVDEAANEYVNGTLADEGAATLYNIRVQREIFEASKQEIDIGIAGPKDETERALYNATYDALLSNKMTGEQARNTIGQTYRNKTPSASEKTYDETQREWYYKEHVPWLERQRQRRNRKPVPNGNG